MAARPMGAPTHWSASEFLEAVSADILANYQSRHETTR
jgi:hypothetical protein